MAPKVLISDKLSSAAVQIFKDHGVRNGNAHFPRGVQVQIGLRLAALDMLPAAVNVPPECVGKAKMRQVTAKPTHRA